MASEAKYKELEQVVSDGRIAFDEPMSAHTSFRIGGPADVYIEAPKDEFIEVLKWCKRSDVPYFVMGNGSNLLVGDGGIRGVVLCTSQMTDIKTDRENQIITAEAGASLPQLSAIAAKLSYTGLEFAAGIPGSIGGAVAMNAGAYGGEIADVIISADAVDIDGHLHTFAGDELDLGYRHSRILDEELYVVEASFKLNEGDHEKITSAISDFMSRRREKQPLELPSAGSTFKRPEGHFAGQLIDEAGLRGYRVGNAQVSEKHCGFVVNLGGATASEVRQLMQDVSDRVFKNSGVLLEPEVRMIGEFV